MEMDLFIKIVSMTTYLWLGRHYFKHHQPLPGVCYITLAGCGAMYIARL